MEADPDSLFLQLLFFSLLAISSIGLILPILLIILLLLCSAMISGSEVAYFSLDSADIKQLEQEENTQNNRILKLKEQPRKLLATILICNNFINIAIVVLSDFVLKNTLSEATRLSWAEGLQSVFPFLQGSSSIFIADGINFLIAVVGVTFLLVLFGEVAPKIYAKINNLKLAKMMSRPLVFLSRLFSPASNLLVKGTNIFENRFAKSQKNGSVTSRQDIHQAIELTVQNELNAGQDMDILKSIVKFGDVTVKQIMRSRVDVIALDFRTTYKKLLRSVRLSGYSRVPVFDEDFDNVTGILYVKDIIPHLNEKPDFEWQELIRTNVFYVPESKKINDLLKEFQEQRTHMAIVVDEYGGSSGIVTLEDIMEEVIGEIKDEFDTEREIDFVKIDDYNYVFEGKTLLFDVCRVMRVNTNTFDEIKGDADSIAGLVLEVAGHIPKKDTVLSHASFNFQIVNVNKRRIERVKITLPSNISKNTES